MFDELADAHGFANETEIGLQLGPLHHCCLRAVGAEGVPSEETGEVLHETESLVATHCKKEPSVMVVAYTLQSWENKRTRRRDKLVVVSHRRVVYESVGDHCVL